MKNYFAAHFYENSGRTIILHMKNHLTLLGGLSVKEFYRLIEQLPLPGMWAIMPHAQQPVHPPLYRRR